MGVTISTSLQALKAGRQLNKSADTLASIYERLSSGLRINNAADDAAGLAVAESLKAESRVYTQALRNVNDGMSLLSVAEGALQELSSITIRQKELATQAANGSYTTKQRQSMNAEATALTDEFNRIVQSTKFNGIGLLDLSSSGNIRIQCGYGTEGSISFALGGELARNVGSGTFGATTSFITGPSPGKLMMSDMNGDGISDLVTINSNGNSVSILLSNGNGTFKKYQDFATGTFPDGATIGDFNGDGRLDVATADWTSGSVSLLLGNGNGTLQPRISLASGFAGEPGLASSDFNGDGYLDLAQSDKSGATSIMLGNGNGTFQAKRSFIAGTAFACASTSDLNNDGITDLVSMDDNANELNVVMGNGNGTFQARRLIFSYPGVTSVVRDVQMADLNQDGVKDMVLTWAGGTSSTHMATLLGNGDGTFRLAASFTPASDPCALQLMDMNGDGRLDALTANYADKSLSVSLGNGDGTFAKPLVTSSVGSALGPYAITSADINGDGIPEAISNEDSSGNNTFYVHFQNIAQTTQTPYYDLTSQSGALAAMGTLDQILGHISAEQGALGSYQSRLQAAANVILVTRENFDAAFGRIMDADIAEESANLIRTQIVQQAAAAILAQANQQPALVLKLLK